MIIVLKGDHSVTLRTLDQYSRRLTVRPGQESLNFQSAVMRNDERYLKGVSEADYVHLVDPDDATLSVAIKFRRSDVVVTDMQDGGARIKGTYGKAVETIDVDLLMRKGVRLIPYDGFYDGVLLQGMNGNAALQGVDVSTICQLIGRNVRTLQTLVNRVMDDRDSFHLDVRYGNIIKICTMLEHGERLGLSCLMTSSVLVESGQVVGEDGLLDKRYRHLSESEQLTMIESMRRTGYPGIIANIVGGDSQLSVKIPQSMIDASDYVVEVLNDSTFLALHKGQWMS